MMDGYNTEKCSPRGDNAETERCTEFNDILNAQSDLRDRLDSIDITLNRILFRLRGPVNVGKDGCDDAKEPNTDSLIRSFNNLCDDYNRVISDIESSVNEMENYI